MPKYSKISLFIVNENVFHVNHRRDDLLNSVSILLQISFMFGPDNVCISSANKVIDPLYTGNLFVLIDHWVRMIAAAFMIVTAPILESLLHSALRMPDSVSYLIYPRPRRGGGIINCPRLSVRPSVGLSVRPSLACLDITEWMNEWMNDVFINVW